jgi:hypothetical protein
MKSRIALSVLFVLIATTAFASDATVAFEKLKTLQGTWAGQGPEGAAVRISNRIISNGSVLMSEIQGGGEDMVTMIHLDGDRLMLTHYCAMGNQPRMIGTLSPDGKTITFNFLDATNLKSSQAEHMHRLTFTFVDADHHVETFESAGSRAGQESMELHRVQ